MNRGFTLIETIIYIGLFAIVIGGGMVAAYEIISNTSGNGNHVVMEEEANFLLRKVNWALTGATSVSSTASPATLTVVKNINGTATNLVFTLAGSNLTLKRGAGSAITLNSSSITVSNLVFSPISTNGMQTSFTLSTIQDGKDVTESFSTTKYLRQ